jgi:N-acetylglucosamine-6-sulfatase
MARGARPSRRAALLAASIVVLAVAAGFPAPTRPDPATLPPNIILILTDDQSVDTLPSEPASMPWLQSQLFGNPGGHWLWFPNAFLNTPLCCPSRATILTGQYSHHTHVQGNEEGMNLDESNTLATWLHGGGYTTALIGKYLNNYPWNRGPYMPPGWDRFFGKRNEAEPETYYDYGVIDQGVPLFVGHTPDAYVTDLLANKAVDFLRGVPAEQPYFLMFTPPAPHAPLVPAPRYINSFVDVPIHGPSERVLNDVAGKPAWIRALPRVTPDGAAAFLNARRLERETLRAADDAVQRIIAEVQARGEMDRTVIFFLTDNGFSFGEHRWRGKRCGYDPCIRTPFAVRTPWASAATVPFPVSNVDLAPTIAALAGVQPGLGEDGINLASLLDAPSARAGPSLDPGSLDRAVLIEYAGDTQVPAWRGVRTGRFAYIEDADGTVELYDLTGQLGPADPDELRNVAGDPAYAGVRLQLATTLARMDS